MGKENIFVIEDDFTQKSGLCDSLKKEGFEVISGKGDGVVSKVIDAAPAIVITEADNNTLNKLKDEEKLKDTEIFVYTEDLDVSTEIALRRLKLTYLFTKGPESNDLVISEVKKFFSPGSIEDDVGLRLFEDDKKYTEPNVIMDPIDDLAEKPSSSLTLSNGETVDYEADFKVAEMMFHAGKLKDAFDKFKVTAKSPGYKIKSILMMGLCLKKLNKVKEAIVVLQKGMKKTEDHDEKMEFQYELGVILHDIGKLKEAFQFLARVFKSDKKFRDTAVRLKDIKSKLKS